MQTLLRAVYYSAVEPSTKRALREYVAKYYEVSPLTQPVKEFTGNISGGAYHHGNEYHVYVKGWPEGLLHQCVMSEGEREKATLEYLHLQGLGLTVIGFGHTTTTDITKLPKVKFLGFIGIKT